MSSQELVSKIERLAPDDYNIVVMLVERLMEKQSTLQRLSEDELIAELTMSADRSDLGYTKPARQVAEEMRQKYAV